MALAAVSILAETETPPQGIARKNGRDLARAAQDLPSHPSRGRVCSDMVWLDRQSATAGWERRPPVWQKNEALKMGRLTYNSSLDAYFDDRTLAHLQVVISVKLNHLESFPLSWRDGNGGGAGRNVIWLHPNVPLVYTFTSSRVQDLNPIWLQLLLETANSVDGLSIVPEPDFPPPVPRP